MCQKQRDDFVNNHKCNHQSSRMSLRRYLTIKNLFSRTYAKKSKDLDAPPTAWHGDAGKSKILSGEILPKCHDIFKVIGVTEELLCFIGIAKEHAKESNHEYIDKLKRIQTVIIEISTSVSRNTTENSQTITSLHTKELEEWIALYSKELPPPEKYIIPGSGVTSASLQLARSICRKTERYIVPYVQNGKLNTEVQSYLNRLSEFLFIVSRISAKLDKQHENIYITKPEHKLQDQ